MSTELGSGATATTLYYLLRARYSNSHINSYDPYQWRLKLFMIIFQYGPTWSRRMAIQYSLRNMTDDELMKGNVNIFNNASNPDTEPTTETWDTIQGINSQSTTLKKRGKLDALAYLDDMLRTDLTGEFLDRFKRLFLQIESPQAPLAYPSIDGYEGSAPLLGGNQPFGVYQTNTFEDMYPTVEEFLNDYQNTGIPPMIPV